MYDGELKNLGLRCDTLQSEKNDVLMQGGIGFLLPPRFSIFRCRFFERRKFDYVRQVHTKMAGCLIRIAVQSVFSVFSDREGWAVFVFPDHHLVYTNKDHEHKKSADADVRTFAMCVSLARERAGRRTHGIDQSRYGPSNGNHSN